MKDQKLYMLFSLVMLFMVATPMAIAQDTEFVPLQPVPGFIDADSTDDVPSFLNNAFRVGVGIAAILAVIVIIIGGFEYMTSEIPGMKSDAKARITAAILGLAIILLSWLILSVINPRILEFRIFESGGGSASGSGGRTIVAEARYCNHTFIQGSAAGTRAYASESECQERCRAEHPDGVCVTIDNI